MITDKLILAILSMVLAMITIVLGFWAYILSLRTNIRLKYRNIVSGEKLEKLVRREYSQRMVFAMTLFLVVLVSLGIISFILLLVMKNNIPLS